MVGSMWKKTGHLVAQSEGYSAFIPLPFPQKEDRLKLPPSLEIKHGEAMRLIGKLDGISHLLPDVNFFLLMFERREAASSSQIEGTQATLIDAIEAEVLPKEAQAYDVSDITCYIRALNYGMKRLDTLPLSIRFIRELHQELMKDGRATQRAFPGEFRYTQNWIGGTSPSKARFVPPPPYEVARAMGDIELFLHDKTESYPPLLQAALLHAQFETVHPFTDGNGRTGRLLVTLFLWKERLLEYPLLYLSEFFRQNQSAYYDRLQAYHSEQADIEGWISFFLDGIITTSQSAITLASDINALREKDMTKAHTLGKVAAASAVEVLRHLYRQPIVDVATVQEWAKMSTRTGAQKVIDRLVDLHILVPQKKEKTYGKTYEYSAYLKLFF